MKKIGITGSIGSGKSYVANILREDKIPVLDLDEVAKEVRNTSAKQDIITYFGDRVLSNNMIDTKKLGTIVFHNEKDKKMLESFIHPYVLKRMLSFFETHKNYKYVVVEQAILFESGWETYYDEIWLVDCSSEVALERLMKYRGYSREQAEAIYSSQLSNIEKRKLADYVIINNDGEEEIRKQIDKILEKE